MSLQISGADVGADINGITQALNNLQQKVILDAINKMNSSLSTLRESVDEAWVGQSAENFKSNMETDKDAIVQALQDSYDSLKSEMDQIISKMGEADEALIEKR